ncbi:RES family NAD+ phosphorylase [soil metagenome]|nr:RES family NAD+ phosphorylase [Gemmatimonadota bacterium]
MSPLPLPPTLPLVRRAAGQVYWRLHERRHGALYFDRRPNGRFNAPAGEYGTCYLADSLGASFLETLVRGSRHRVIPRARLEVRTATTIELLAEVRLFRFHSDALPRLGASAGLPHAAVYEECQQIALAVWQHPEGVDGIEYRSRWDDSRLCAAIFDRAATKLHPAASRPLDDLTLVRPVLHRYDIGIV